MKTLKDFKIVNSVATLEGVSFVEETNVVIDFLQNNTDIKNVTIKGSNGKYYHLINNKLIPSEEKTFENPYYINNLKDQETSLTNQNNSTLLYLLETRIAKLEKVIEDLRELFLNRERK